MGLLGFKIALVMVLGWLTRYHLYLINKFEIDDVN